MAEIVTKEAANTKATAYDVSEPVRTPEGMAAYLDALLVQCCTLFGTQAAVGSNDLLQDVGSALGPDERLGLGVVMGDALIDGGHQLRHAGTPWAYSRSMFSVVETSLFQKQWPLCWTEDERGEFAAMMAASPEAGAVVEESGGVWKVRWKRQGTGKSGGVRVIYFVKGAAEEVVLLTLYAKSETDNITGAVLKEIRRALEE